MSYSKTTVIGRFVADPEFRAYGTEGKEIASFRIAADVGRDKTAFYKCTAFDRTSAVIKQFCKKGKQVLVEGHFENNDYEKDVNGTPVKMYDMNFIVNRLVLLGDATGQQQQGAPQQRQAAPQAPQQTQGGFSGFGGFQQQHPNTTATPDPFQTQATYAPQIDDLPF